MDVSFSVTGSVGHVQLDRPGAINALSLDMLRALEIQLGAWASDPRVASIELSGVGKRGFCSGADVRQLRTEVLASDSSTPMDFIATEYRVDALITGFPKPTTAHLHGISMGGGLGLAVPCRRRIATPDLQLAMPETQIGLWPDVGMCYHLARCPGETGTWLAISASTVDAQSAICMGLIDEIDQTLAQAAPSSAGAGAASPDPQAQSVTAPIVADRAWIDECLQGDDPVAMVRKLEAHSDPRARAGAALLRTRSPWSVATALAAVRRAAAMPDVESVLTQDLTLARHMLFQSDFAEGVRAQLVDKDHAPQWRYARLEEVPLHQVDAQFD